MHFILMLVGLIFILGWLSKQFNRLGNFLTVMGLEIMDHKAAIDKINFNELKQRNKKVADDLSHIKEEVGSNVIFSKNIRDEIDQLERELNT